MNPTETIKKTGAETIEADATHEAARAAMPFDPPTEELMIARSDVEGRKQLLATHIIDGYLKGHFDLDLSNEVHRGVHAILAEQGKLRPPISSVIEARPSYRVSEA